MNAYGGSRTDRLFSLVHREVEYDSTEKCIILKKMIPAKWDGIWESQPSVDQEINWPPSYLLIGLPGDGPQYKYDKWVMTSLFKDFAKIIPRFMKDRLSGADAPVILGSHLCDTVDQVTAHFNELHQAPTVLVFVGHGTFNGRYLSARQGRYRDMGPSHFQHLFDHLTTLPRGSQLRLCIFISCDLGKPGGLTERLAQLSPVTTISFERPVWKKDCLYQPLAIKFARSIVFLHAGLHTGNRSITYHLLGAAPKPGEPPLTIHRLLFVWASQMDPESGGATVYHAKYLMSRPIMRNERGYHDLAWWPMDKLRLMWSTYRSQAERFMREMDLHGFFHHKVFRSLPGRKLVMPPESYVQMLLIKNGTNSDDDVEMTVVDGKGADEDVEMLRTTPMDIFKWETNSLQSSTVEDTLRSTWRKGRHGLTARHKRDMEKRKNRAAKRRRRKACLKRNGCR